MNLKQFKYVVVLANEGSFGRAAVALNISQPSLSQYIKNIEKQLGTTLFDRTGGSVNLTEAGRVYISVGKRMLDLEHQMLNQINDLADFKTGSVTVGTSPYRSASMMPTLAKHFRSIYPGMHLVVDEMTTKELIEGAEHGKFDLCITMLPIDEAVFSYEKIAEEELILAVPSQFGKLKATTLPNRKHLAIDVTTLDKQPLVVLTEGQVMQQFLEGLCEKFNFSVKKAAVVKSLEAQIAMVRAGVGMALVPSGIEGFCATDEVDFYSFSQELPRRNVVAMWRKDKPLNKAASSLLQIMRETKW